MKIETLRILQDLEQMQSIAAKNKISYQLMEVFKAPCKIQLRINNITRYFFTVSEALAWAQGYEDGKNE